MKSKNNKSLIPKSDALFKSIMETDVATYEFLDTYLPESIKSKVDLKKATVEKESFVEEDLKKRLSDVVYSVPYKKTDSEKQQKVFIYSLIEHQSTSDKWIALRLWKYILLLCERHKDKNEKLPIVIPFVLYNGKTKYSAPRCFWDLFDSPDLAKDTMNGPYNLIDLQSMSDEELIAQKHLGMMQFWMKHIHESDMIALWKKFFNQFKDLILYDRNVGYIYIKQFIWYTDAKLDEKDIRALNEVILEHLPKNEGEEIMSTVAENYIQTGMVQGVAQGVAQGKAERNAEIVKNLLSMKKPISEIKMITGLSEKEIRALITSQ